MLRGQPIDLVLCDGAAGPPAQILSRVLGGATLIVLGTSGLSPQCTAAATVALRAGAYDYLPPPHRPADIVLALHKAAAREAARGDLFASCDRGPLPADDAWLNTGPSSGPNR